MRRPGTESIHHDQVKERLHSGLLTEKLLNLLSSGVNRFLRCYLSGLGIEEFGYVCLFSL